MLKYMLVSAAVMLELGLVLDPSISPAGVMYINAYILFIAAAVVFFAKIIQ